MTRQPRVSVIILLLACAMVICLAYPLAAKIPAPVSGQVLYLPLYHQVFIDQREFDYHLTCTLVIRNTDASVPITILQARYYDEQGSARQDLLPQPVEIPSLGAIRRLVKPAGMDVKNACLIIKWQAPKPVSPPLVQAVMVGTRSTLGVSFATTAIPVAPNSAPVQR